MKIGLLRLGRLLVLATVAFAGAAMLVPEIAAAKPPKIAASSCGAGAGPIGDYCNF